MANPVQMDGSADFLLYIDYEVLSQSVASNTSQVRLTLRAVDADSINLTWSNYSSSWSITGGSTSSGNKASFDFRDGDTEIIAQVTQTITHNTDGTKTLTLSGYWNSGHGSVGKGTASRSVTLPTIPRATTPTVSAGSVDAGSSVTINTPRASGSFTHTLKYSFLGATGTIATGVATSHSWSVPLSLLNQIPSATSGVCVITCETYSGATLIGSKTVNVTIRAGSGVIPDFTTVTHSEAVAAVNTAVGAYVQGQTKLNLAITGAAGIYGSTITAYQITVSGQTLSSQSGATPNAISGSGTVVITGKVTDSRGRTRTRTVNITVLARAVPTITSLLVRRCTSGGTVSADGTYLRVDLNAAVSSLINGTQRNTITYKVETRPTGGSWSTKANTTPAGITYNSNFVVGTGGEYSVAASYEVRVTVSDKFGNVLASRTIATAQVPLDVAAAGIGIGKVHEQGALDILGDVYSDGTLAPLGDTGWLTPTLENSFTEGQPIRYKRLNGVVYLRGELLRTTAPTSSTTAFTLPSGYRPAGRLRTVNWAANITQFVGVTVNTDGKVDIICDFTRTSTPGYSVVFAFPAA